MRNLPRRDYLARVARSSTSIVHGQRVKYPGESFDENRQCEFVFGKGSRICSYMPPCSRLWCTTASDGGEEKGCRTQHMPWADGTACGSGHWCMRGECVAKNGVQAASPVEGQWGEWQR